MAIDSFMQFTKYDGSSLKAELQVDLSDNTSEPLAKGLTAGNVFEVDDYSFDIEQQLNIGSQSSGAGAGKVQFNPFSITRKIDLASPTFFQMACSGTPFQMVSLALRKSAGGNMTGKFFLRFDFKLVAVKTIEWAHDDESPKETVTFEYGGMFVRYGQQLPDGTIPNLIPAGWNRVKNIADPNWDTLIK